MCLPILTAPAKGCIYLISMFYKRNELQTRLNLYFSASIIAGSFSGLLAYAMANMSGVAGYSGWRWIFIRECIFTFFVAAVSYFIIPDWPHIAKFLTEDERALLINRLEADHAGASMNHWDKGTAKRCFGDIKIYFGVLMYMGIVTTSYSGAFFSPTILKQLGWTSVKAQVMIIPIYVVSTIIAITCAVASDKLRHRFGFVIGGCFLSSIGYAILLNMHHVAVGARYFAMYAVICGANTAQPLTLGWLSNNVSGHYKRSVSSAMQIGIGNVGGMLSVFIPSPFFCIIELL